MIVVLQDNADVASVGRALQGLGLWAKPLVAQALSDTQPAAVLIEVEDASTQVDPADVLAIEGVAAVQQRKSPHPKLDGMAPQHTLTLRNGKTLTLGGEELVLTAGPCAVESPAQIAQAAAMAVAAGAKLLRGGAFKPRTSPYSFKGEGLQALQWLADAAAAHGLGVVTEAMSELHVADVAAVADLIQVGSRNMQNYALLAAIGNTGKPVLLKRARGASVDEWLQAGEHLLAHGAAWVMFCERGVAGLAGQTRNTIDLGAVALLRHVQRVPVAVDPSHAAGRRDLVIPLAKAAVGAGAQMILVELHGDPALARSDGPQALTRAHLPELVTALGLGKPPIAVLPQPAELPPRTSRFPEFYKKSVAQRRQYLHEQVGLSAEAQRYLQDGTLPIDLADRMTENVIGTFALPLSLGLNFRVNGKDFVVPMVVEEPSVVAAASNAARMVRATGGFRGDATTSVMTAQVQFDHVGNVEEAAARIAARREEVIALANSAIPRMVARGGGCKDIDIRVLDATQGLLVLHLYVDVGDAMGANTVDTVAEQVAPAVQSWIGGDIGLRILSNLPLRRIVHVECEVGAEMLGGDALADGIARASHFADMDAFRASTHNKGILNGIDAVALALGQDWRAIEAGAHSYAGLGREYRPLATWRRTPTGLHGEMELPLAIGTVGGSVTAHPGVRTAMEIIRVDGARQLAVVMAAVGMASNLAALRALAGEGIQQGHMRLHNRKQDATSLEPNGHVQAGGLHSGHEAVRKSA
jgi:hydroxymethylglutaryl-CoA reductase